MARGHRMAVMKKSVRKKLSKYLERLVKKHGAEMTLALVTGIVSSLAADIQAKVDRKAKAEKAARAARPDQGKPDKEKPVARPEKTVTPEPVAGRKPAVVVRKRAER